MMFLMLQPAPYEFTRVSVDGEVKYVPNRVDADILPLQPDLVITRDWGIIEIRAYGDRVDVAILPRVVAKAVVVAKAS